MDFTALDYESLPILLSIKLAQDEESWSVTLHDSEGGVLAEGDLLNETSWEMAVLEEAGGAVRVVPWDLVAKVEV